MWGVLDYIYRLYSGTEELVSSADQVGSRVEGDTCIDDEQVPQYDYIIVGAGTAGSVIASRLTESQDDKPSVLVIEPAARVNDYLSSIPLIAMLRGNSEKYAHKINTTKQSGLAGRTIEMLTGRLVGGSSAINVGLYTRGPNRELDEWESSYGCKGWNHKDLQRYLDVPFCNDMSSSVKTSRDGKGPWEYSFGKKHQYVLTEKVFSTLDSMGLGRIDNDPYKHDEKKGPIGSGCFTFQSAVSRDGKKVHAGNAYLTDAILRSRSNLTLCTKAKVTQIKFADRDGEEQSLTATGVTFCDEKGNIYFAKARRRVILCAGVLHTPHILLKSGIGPSVDLRRYKIPKILDSPQVGRNFQDHIGVPLHFLIPYHLSSIAISDGLYGIPIIIKSIYDYFVNGGKGFLASPAFIEASGWFYSDDIQYRIHKGSSRSEMIIECKKDPHSTIPNIELMFSTYWLEWAQTRFKGLDQDRYIDPKGIMGIYVILTQPRSIGSVKIAFDGGVELDPGYFTDVDGEDLKTMQKGIKFALQVANNLQNLFKISPADIPGWNHKQGRYIDKDTPLQVGSAFAHPDDISDGMYTSFIQAKATPIYHGTSTCKMGNDKATSVVDATTMNVWGTTNLTIFDTSVFPKVNATHPQSLVFAGAEKVADSIIASD